MALQLGALRDALLDAGAKPEKADRAAEELAGYESRFVVLERAADERHADVIARLAAIDVKFAVADGQLQRITWMTGVLIVLVVGILGRLLIR